MCIQWSRDEIIFSVVITQQFNPPIYQFNSRCNEFMGVWSVFTCNNFTNRAASWI